MKNFFQIIGRGLAALMLLVAVVPLAAQAQSADEGTVRVGGDVFSAGESVTIATSVDNDAFAAGNSVTISAGVGGDIHMVGNTISASGEVGGNVYAGGNTVSIAANVSRDVTVAGNNVTMSGQWISGNVRAGGNVVQIDADVAGSASVGAETLVLNGRIAGDLQVGANAITFGPNARVDGMVNIESGHTIDVPESVASADRVTMTVHEGESKGPGNIAQQIATETSRGVFGEFLAGTGFYVGVFILGAIWLALFRARSEDSFAAAAFAPWRSLVAGVFSLAAFLGLTVVLGLTLVGIILIPISIVLAVFAWILGLAAGAYFLARRIGGAFGQHADSLGMRVIMLAVGLVLVWLLGIVPVIGWLLVIASVLMGLGGMTMAALYGGPEPQDAIEG